MDHGDPGIADERLDVEVGERRRREEERVGEEVVEASAVPADHDHTLRAATTGGVQRELEVTLVLVGRVAANLGTARHRSFDRGGIGGVEVPDHEIHATPERECDLDTRVCGDNGHARLREARRDAAVDGVATREHERHGPSGRLHGLPFSLRRNYPVQVPRVGGASRIAARSPSQPGCPELPTGRDASYRLGRLRPAPVSCAKVRLCHVLRAS